MKQRMPGDFEEEIRFFGRFTWKDLIRMGLPPIVAAQSAGLTSTAGSIAVLFTGGVVGAAWYLFRPGGQPVDIHLYHLLRWVIT
ncbi:hypothetical protein [Natronobacterium texcoconense]|uniref:PrgI family protein n=1 Tax=Natronobacterium texcoconense TaxID=1095778 RepID=A0A1H1ALP6_NATTX|nr:hypothetical protein [Natronobacterium texcoconense]SDQ40655.1 hypothetical protein SAMN04489842_0738 [Natronobacterium texcoconense]